MSTEKQCENCTFWKKGDLSAQEIENVGTCTWALARKPDPSEDVKHVPFWMGQITRQTVSWEGKGCRQHKAARNRAGEEGR